MRPLIAAVALAVVAGTMPARSGDIQGDAYDCAELWTMRNQIYKDNGYCFKTARAIAAFGNAGCRFDDVDDVPFSENTRTILRDIKRSEKRQGC